MMTHYDRDTLIDYLHGGLRPDADAAVFAHLEACEDCRGLLDAADPPVDIVAATLAALAARADWAPWLDRAGRRAYLVEVAAACASWQVDGLLRPSGEGLQIEVV